MNEEVADRLVRALKYLSGANMVLLKIEREKVMAIAFWRGPLEPVEALGLMEDFKEILVDLMYELGFVEPGEVLKELKSELECDSEEGCKGFVIKQILAPFP